jgi:hypothetical protein
LHVGLSEAFRKVDLFFFFSFFRRDALKEQFGKRPNTVRCLAVKSTLLGTRHPRKKVRSKQIIDPKSAVPVEQRGPISVSPTSVQTRIIFQNLNVLRSYDLFILQNLLSGS